MRKEERGGWPRGRKEGRGGVERGEGSGTLTVFGKHALHWTLSSFSSEANSNPMKVKITLHIAVCDKMPHWFQVIPLHEISQQPIDGFATWGIEETFTRGCYQLVASQGGWWHP